MNYKEFYLSKSLYVILLLSIIINVYNHNLNIFTLSNDKIAMITKDGISFYTDKMIEEVNINIIFENQIPSDIEQEKITLAQFSEKDEEYIMILILNKIYFFEKDGSKINSIDITSSSPIYFSPKYTLIPYKKQNNFLHYIIIHVSENNKNIVLNHFKFDINSPNSNQLILSKNIEIKTNNSIIIPINLSKINCNFMLDSYLNRDILVCFYALSYSNIEIQSRAFDPLNSFNEIVEYSKKYEFKDTNFKFPNYISIMGNKDKNKTLIYLVNGYPYMMSFDLKQNFSEPFKIVNNGNFKYDYSQNKILYLKKNNEILVLSSIKYDSCKIFIIYFNSDLEIKYKGIIDQDNQCLNLNSYSSFSNGIIYSIIDNNNTYELKILNKKIRNLASNNNKCENSNDDSLVYDLCISCNQNNHFYQVEESFYWNSPYVDCYNEQTKPANFYLDETERKYKPCYETCARCNKGGDEFNNNCISCAEHHRFRPGFITDCVTFCTYFYYFTPYGQYKCSYGSNCPEEAPLYILDLKKCTDDCSNEDEYKLQYGGQCMKECPEGTSITTDSKNCKDNEVNECLKTDIKLDIQGSTLIETVNIGAKIYIEEFGYTNKHISYYYNDEYSILIYKDYECIEKLKINITKMEFDECYIKVHESLNLQDTQKIVIALVERKNDKGQSMSIFYFYDPKTGKNINVTSICKDVQVIVKESVLTQLNNTDLDYDSLLYLTKQNIDIFNKSDAFYTDICFHFDSPNRKDVPLKDRVLSFYPNISLCDDECIIKGVNLTTMESICECIMSKILNNDLISDNFFFDNTLGKVTDFISNNNLDIMKCYKEVFQMQYFKKNTGGIIILCIIFLEIILSVIFLIISMNNIKNYLNNLSDFFSSLIVIRNKEKQNIENNNNKNELKKHELKSPPKKDYKNIIKKSSKNSIKENDNKSNIDFGNSDDYNNKLDLLSQKSFDRLGKIRKEETKITRSLFNNNKNEKKNKNDKDGGMSKKEYRTEIKKIKDKYGIDEEEYLKTDLDDMDYDDAIKYDKRTFCQYFYDKFKANQIIMDTFFNPDDLKPVTIKVILLLLNIELYFVVNGLLYSENYISELFHSDKKDKFFSYFGRSISRFFYTTIVGGIISTIIEFLFVEEKKVKRVFLREKDNEEQVKYEISLIIQNVKKNYIIFIGISLFISLFSWYYICCFNNVYPRVKGEWIKSSITIIIIMQILSFLAGAFAALIRLIAFKCKSERLYKLKDYFD